jgi:hypothetical protein
LGILLEPYRFIAVLFGAVLSCIYRASSLEGIEQPLKSSNRDSSHSHISTISFTSMPPCIKRTPTTLQPTWTPNQPRSIIEAKRRGLTRKSGKGTISRDLKSSQPLSTVDGPDDYKAAEGIAVASQGPVEVEVESSWSRAGVVIDMYALCNYWQAGFDLIWLDLVVPRSAMYKYVREVDL